MPGVGTVAKVYVGPDLCGCGDCKCVYCQTFSINEVLLEGAAELMR